MSNLPDAALGSVSGEADEARLERTVTALTTIAVILVAEDEPLIRLNAALLFEDAGFEVVEASTASAALAMLEKRDGRVAALFTDVDMPGDMNGLELAGIVHSRWLYIALLVTSGVV